MDRRNDGLKGENSCSAWDHSTQDEFFEYYLESSLSEETFHRFRSVRDCVLRFAGMPTNRADPVLEVADIGCGAGTQSMIWAELGHRVHALDVSSRLVELAAERAKAAGYSVDCRIGSASELPWGDNSMDVCLVLELLEHVPDWKACIEEFVRILRPGGILFLTTTNRLCPVQSEYNLPAYSWYPAPVKRRIEKMAKTTHPQIINFATYPAVNWFRFHDFGVLLGSRGFRCFDRFDIMNLENKGKGTKGIVKLVRSLPPLRFLAHLATPGTTVLAVKHRRN